MCLRRGGKVFAADDEGPGQVFRARGQADAGDVKGRWAPDAFVEVQIFLVGQDQFRICGEFR